MPPNDTPQNQFFTDDTKADVEVVFQANDCKYGGSSADCSRFNQQLDYQIPSTFTGTQFYSCNEVGCSGNAFTRESRG